MRVDSIDDDDDKEDDEEEEEERNQHLLFIVYRGNLYNQSAGSII